MLFLSRSSLFSSIACVSLSLLGSFHAPEARAMQAAPLPHNFKKGDALPLQSKFYSYDRLFKNKKKNAPLRTLVSTYALEIDWTPLDTDTKCGDLVTKLSNFLFPNTAPDLVGEGIIACFDMADGKQFYVKVDLEPYDDSAIGSMEEYLKGHEGIAVYGHLLHYRRAFAALGTVLIVPGTLPPETDNYDFTSFFRTDKKTQSFPNLGEWNRYWWTTITDAGRSIDSLVDLLRREFGKSLAGYYNEIALTKSNGVALDSDVQLILEDQTLFAPDFTVNYLHDCRKLPKQMCK